MDIPHVPKQDRENFETPKPIAFNLEKFKAELNSPAFKERVQRTQERIVELKRHAVIDRSRLFIPVDF
jgi:hypothetical protein